MSKMSRREFTKKIVVSSSAVGILGATAGEPATGPLGFPIGSQIWPLWSMLKDFPAFAKQIAGLGVSRLELCSPIGYGEEFASLTDAKEVRKILTDHGISSESSHFTMAELRKSQGQSLEWAKDIGITQIITATLGDGNGGNNPSLDQVKRAAEEYNQIAAISAKAGFQQGLHNEGFEMSMVEGKRTYDLLFDWLDPKLVKFQFQMSTITAGYVAADYFHKYPGRFNSMHLQDVDMKSSSKGSEGNATAPRGGRYSQVALGTGSIDWIKTFSAARVGGVKNYFVEQNWELTQASVAYLKNLKV